MVKQIEVLPKFEPGVLTFGEMPKFQYRRRISDELGDRLTAEDAVLMLDMMLLIRSFEEMIISLKDGSYKPTEGFQFTGATHLSIGQEAVAVGSMAAIEPTDLITSTHRGHGHGIAKTGAGDARDFKNQVMMYVGRGLMLWELYITPRIMTEEELDFLARTLVWAEKNAALLATSQMVLGNPFNNEVYGYMHLGNGHGLLFLRNPAEGKVTATLDIERDVMLNESGHASCRLNGIYPEENRLTHSAGRNDTVRIEMEPNSVMTFEVHLN